MKIPLLVTPEFINITTKTTDHKYRYKNRTQFRNYSI